MRVALAACLVAVAAAELHAQSADDGTHAGYVTPSAAFAASWGCDSTQLAPQRRASLEFAPGARKELEVRTACHLLMLLGAPTSVDSMPRAEGRRITKWSYGAGPSVLESFSVELVHDTVGGGQWHLRQPRTLMVH